MGSGVLDGGDRRVDGEHISDVLGALGLQTVVSEAVNKRHVKLPEGPDNVGWSSSWVYSSEARVEFCLRASERCLAPSAPKLFRWRLQTGPSTKC